MKYCIIGGAGFIGSNLVKTLLNEEKDSAILVYDNFSSGKIWHFDGYEHDKRLSIVRGDVKNERQLRKAVKGSDIVYHFASNPDISKAIIQPDIDFWKGTYLTNNILEAMRINKVNKLLYASGSGIYGDAGAIEMREDHSPMLPISTYGASKLACEALISSYCYMFGITATAFRFANVVGPHQTHGVVYDFIRRLSDNQYQLPILGDGTQSKSYLYIDDVINALRILEKKAPPGFSFYNVSSNDYITVMEIADIVVKLMILKGVKYIYTGGKRGWKGDVPIVRLNSDKIRLLGWRNKYSSKEAICNSASFLYKEFKEYKNG